jgi:hypothetical protein
MPNAPKRTRPCERRRPERDRGVEQRVYAVQPQSRRLAGRIARQKSWTQAWVSNAFAAPCRALVPTTTPTCGSRCSISWANFPGHAYEGTYPGSDAGTGKSGRRHARRGRSPARGEFAIADGEMPDNGGAGYVIRRILRRAVRYYYSVLDIKEPVMYRMAPILAEEFHDVFPELKAQIDFVSQGGFGRRKRLFADFGIGFETF